MNKHFYQQLLRSVIPVITCYLLLVALMGILVVLYNLPLIFWGDIIRFSLPILIIWLIIDTVIKRSRQRRLNMSNLNGFIPTTPMEAKLFKLLLTQQNTQQDRIQKLQLMQRQQFDHLELFTHEIKNYLTSLNAAAENDPSVNSREVKNNVRQANYYLNLLLNDERLAMDTHDFDFQWINLADLVNEILQQNSAIFIRKQLIPQITGLANIRIMTDQKWLRFCIEQLLSNAIKYSPIGKVITISWEINSLKIADQGKGIASNDLPRIFENGFTGHNGHHNTASTGMGLYLVKKVTDQLNFKINISSNNQGTTAILSFIPDNIKQA